jgi:hypothetical protein
MAAEILIKGAALLALASQALALPTSQPSYDIDQSDADESHLFRRQCGVAGNIPARFRQELLSDEEGGRVRPTKPDQHMFNADNTIPGPPKLPIQTTHRPARLWRQHRLRNRRHRGRRHDLQLVRRRQP